MYRILFALFVVFALSGAAVACDSNAVVLGLNSYGAQAVVVPSYGVQALNVGYGFGRQQVIVGNRQQVFVNRGFNRQAVVVGGGRQQVIVQNRGLFGGSLFGRQRVIINN